MQGLLGGLSFAPAESREKGAIPAHVRNRLKAVAFSK